MPHHTHHTILYQELALGIEGEREDGAVVAAQCLGHVVRQRDNLDITVTGSKLVEIIHTCIHLANCYYVRYILGSGGKHGARHVEGHGANRGSKAGRERLKLALAGEHL